jgi:hypothetical protein
LASGLVLRLELWKFDPALARVAKELRVSYEWEWLQAVGGTH